MRKTLHAHELWSLFLEAADDRQIFPPLDRWLSDEFKARGKWIPKDLRDRLSEEVFAVARFCELALVLEEVFRDLGQGFLWKSRGKLSATKLEAALFAPRKPLGAGAPKVTFERLAAAQAEGLTTWALLRLGTKVPDSERTKFFEAARPLLETSTRIEAQMLWHGFPLAFAEALDARARRSKWNAEKTAEFVKAQAAVSNLWLRLNDEKHRELTMAELKGAGLKPVAHVSGAIGVRGRTSIYELEAFKNGLLEIQDLASQLIGSAVGTMPGDRIWDSCAGEGGKTAQIAAALQGQGFVYASDRSERKLESLKLRMRRAGFSNVRIAAWDGETLPEFGVEVQARKGFDIVLVDAPCSSSGTWRRNPDLKFRVTSREIADYAELQFKILSSAARALKPGGRLVYGTCSWLAEENEAVIERFTKAHKEYTLESLAVHGCPDLEADTMFAAVLRKAGAII